MPHNEIKNECGNRYGRLEVLEFSHVDKHRRACWRCRCECGEETVVPGAYLRSGNTESCGCGEREAAARNMSQYNAWLRNECIRKLFTIGLYPQGPPKEKRK
jgi:hypothetical protein